MSALRIALLSTGAILVLGLLVLFSVRTPVTFAATNPVTTVVPVGSGPASVAVDPAHNQVLVTAQYANLVDAISTGPTYAVTQQITGVGLQPNFIIPWPGTTKYLVADTGSDEIYTIDTGNANQASKLGGPYTTTVNSSLYGLATNTGGSRIYAADNGGNAVYVINGTGNIGNVVATLTNTISAPYDVAFDGTNNQLYVSNAGSNTLSVFDGTTNAFIKTITVGNSPHDVRFDSANNTIYVANDASSTISAINATTDAITTIILPGSGASPKRLALDQTHNRLYVTDYSNNLLIPIDTSNNTVLSGSVVVVGSSPLGLDVDLTPNVVYVANSLNGAGGNSVSVINFGLETTTPTPNVTMTPITTETPTAINSPTPTETSTGATGEIPRAYLPFVLNNSTAGW